MTDTATPDNHFGQLMQAAQSGDADAYMQLLNEITPCIRHIVRRPRRFLEAGDAWIRLVVAQRNAKQIPVHRGFHVRVDGGVRTGRDCRCVDKV